MTSHHIWRARCRFPIAIAAVLAGPVLLLPLAAADAQSTAAGTLCAANEKVWFEASYAGSTGAIAVCSIPGGGDEVGAIRVLQLEPAGSGSTAPRPAVIARAKGAARTDVFTIKRYTRPQTTYLKFEFKNQLMTGIIYDAYDSGETSTSMKQVPADAGAAPQEITLEPKTGSLSLMGLEGVVRTLPFDE